MSTIKPFKNMPTRLTKETQKRKPSKAGSIIDLLPQDKTEDFKNWRTIY